MFKEATMSQQNEEPVASVTTHRSLAKWPLILAALTALSFLGAVMGGIGPCGGPGIFFIIPFFCFGLATVVMLIVNSCRAVQHHRAAHEN
jgi:hypothetical protein